ncbi:hypothetical protein BaRGS_00004620 [Batillaria attramentaria]|uniref:Uncharacterized protein n=1 Tax=Batillaria attramentaria TaxID=370345 RepID=A0ABD0LYR5_9CAEN
MLAALFSSLIIGACALSVKNEPTKMEPFDILKLTQSWPPAVCIFIEKEEKKCNISSEVKSWVVHGLWPTKQGTEGPNFCNDTWKFDVTKVEALRPKLDYNWPSITFDEKPEDTWKHEWEKHGTCGTSLPALKDEFNYFNTTLGLHYHFDLQNDRTYQPEDVLTILKDGLGVYPSITCVEEKGTKTFYIEQVELCLDKTFQPVNCDKTRSTPHQLPATKQGNSLLFQSEKFLGGFQLQDYLIDCPKSGVYYKPLPSK